VRLPIINLNPKIGGVNKGKPWNVLLMSVINLTNVWANSIQLVCAHGGKRSNQYTQTMHETKWQTEELPRGRLSSVLTNQKLLARGSATH